MESFVKNIESVFARIPLPLLEVWGSFGFVAGFIIMLLAYGGFTFRQGEQWGFGREWHSWDKKSVLSIGISFVLILITGQIGSTIVLVPGAQTFESLKDLSVFLCILLFGYPVLLAVPFAYGLADLYEGVPISFLSDWAVGYFINPACFWIAYQFIGKNPDFRLKKVWKNYAIFVLIFMCLEPQLWGYICSGKFTDNISYHNITPALFFTTAITWVMAPFAMLVALPLAKKVGLFWAEIPNHVKERKWKQKEWTWVSGQNTSLSSSHDDKTGYPIRLFLLIPFTIVILLVIGTTAHLTLSNSTKTSLKLGENLHQVISENIILKLENVTFDKINQVMNELPFPKEGIAFITDHSGTVLASSKTQGRERVQLEAIATLNRTSKGIHKLTQPQLLQFDLVTVKPLSRTTWLAHVSPYKKKWIIMTVMPQDYYLEGVNSGNSQSAMIIAIALLFVLIITAILADVVTAPIQKISQASEALSKGELFRRVPASRLTELNTLSNAFNEMATKLQTAFDNIREEVEQRKKHEMELIESASKLKMSENRLQLAARAAGLGIWEWNIETNELIWNDKMYELYGVESLESQKGYEDWQKRLHPEDHDRAVADIDAVIRGDKDYDSEFRILLPDGAIRILKAHSLTFRDVLGKSTRMVGINYDITDKKKAEDELLKYRNHLEELVQVKTAQLTELTEKQAKSEIYEKFAQIFLSLRDFTNNPLQVQTLIAANLKKKYPAEQQLLSSLEKTVETLSHMNRILSRMETKFPASHSNVLSEEEILQYLDMEQNT